MEDVIEAIYIGLTIASFLISTARGLKAIEICKECMILLNYKTLNKRKQVVNSFTTAINQKMFLAYCQVSDYKNAIKCGKELLVISRECGETAKEGKLAIAVASIYERERKYAKARELYEKAINITKDTGHREEQAFACGRFGTMSYRLNEHDRAKEYLGKALVMKTDLGDRKGEAGSYGNLGIVFQSLCEYEKANEYLEKALAIQTDISDREGEATCYGNLGTVFQSLGEYDKAKEHYEKALEIRIELGDRAGEAAGYERLGTVFQSLDEYDKAKEYHEKALAMRTEIGDREGEGSCYGELASVLQHTGEYERAKEFYKKSLATTVEFGDKRGEAANYGNLGKLSHSLGEHVMAEFYLQKALSISQDIGNADGEFQGYCGLTLVKLSQEKIREAFDCLVLSINKSEDLRGFLRNNDQFKIAFSDVHDFPYRHLSAFYCVAGNPENALYVLELLRARTLADLMATQYSLERQISANQQSWIGIENIMKKESSCSCLYISYYHQDVFLWILKTNGTIHFRTIRVNENIIGARLISSLHDFLAKSFRILGILSEQDCEDRTLNGIEPKPISLKDIELKTKLCQEEFLTDLRLVEDDDDDNNQDPEPSLPLLYKMIVAPVAHLLEEPEIIIVPDRSLYQVPFAALTDERGKYLSETFRIRLVPSLSTLKLIQDSPADYHSQTGALIVGDPVVGWVLYKGSRRFFSPLPCARKEAEMIGELLCVQPLLGERATKQEVLRRINSVSLIHFAAHGSAERGEIALSPHRKSEGVKEHRG